MDLEQFTKNIDAMFLTLNAEGCVVSVNKKTCKCTEYSEEELIGMDWIAEFVPDTEQDSVMKAFKVALDSSDKNQVFHFNNHVRSKTGKYHFIQWDYAPRFNDDGDLVEVISIGRDITCVHEAKRRLESLHQNLPAAVFQYIIDENGKEYIDFMSPACEQIWELTQEQIENDIGTLWKLIVPEDVLEMAQSIKESEDNLSPWHHVWRIVTPSGKEKWLEGQGVPSKIVSGGVVWNSFVFDITEQRNYELLITEVFRKTVYVLVSTLEKRDPYTAGHMKNVSLICTKIAEELGWDDRRTAGLELGALVHDIGKIAIPSQILNKSGPLLPAEYDLIKYHPQIGAELLEDMDFEWPIKEMVLQHHERLDGSGYPNGLKGDDIIIEAKIIAIADVLDAMATHRPYRPGIGLDEAIIELKAGSGTEYDPEIVNVCISLIEQGKIKL